MRSLSTLGITSVAVSLALTAGVSVASAQSSPPAADTTVTEQIEQMRASMPPGMQRLHDQMMTGEGAAGMQQMMSGEGAAGMQQMMGRGR